MNIKNIYKIHKIPSFLFWRTVNLNTRTLYFYNFCVLLFSFLMNLFKHPQLLTKTQSDSLLIYENYTDREQIDYDNDELKVACVIEGRLNYANYKEIKEAYLQPIYQVIDSLLEKKGQGTYIKVLEVGAGNCINLMRLKEKYGTVIQLHGVDFSIERLNVAKKYFGHKLDGVSLSQADITQKGVFKNQEFDFVFSMHVLEQISYDSLSALLEIKRIAKQDICLIEPVFENGNYAQRMYLFYNDHIKVLKKNVQFLWNKNEISRIEPLHIQGNVINQSSIISIKQETSN